MLTPPPADSLYPGDNQNLKHANNYGGCAGACFLLVASGLLMCGGLAQMLGEGPHGPKGEITNDPSIVWLLPLLCGSSFVVAGLSIWLFAWSFGWVRKR